MVGPGTGTRTYTDTTRNTYYYQVYAINVVGDTWDYSNPAFNQIPPGGGWPTLTLSSRPDAPVAPAVLAPSNLAGSAVVKNKKTATVTLTWTDNSANETGFVIQRAYNATFTSGVVNATVGPNINSFTQDVSAWHDLLLSGTCFQRHKPVKLVEHRNGNHTVRPS